jgi:hypothetical protein
MARREDEKTVRELKKRWRASQQHGNQRSRNLGAAGPRRRNLAEVLASMPDVGDDADFERVDTNERGPPTSA